MDSKKQIKNIAKTLLAFLIFTGATSVFAQNNQCNKLEEMQNQNEIYLIGVSDIVKDYPHTTCEYVYLDGHLYKVLADGIGEIRNITTAENIESPYGEEVVVLEKSAIDAVSMDWTPDVSNGRLVESDVVIPVTFDFQKDPSIPVFIR